MSAARRFSVIVQGQVNWSISSRTHRPITQSLCESIRRFMPGAELIVSTWQKDNVDGLSFDVLIRTKDPGPQGALPAFTPNNINRQIASTAAGLAAATREYSLKIRSDFELFGADFLDQVPHLPKLTGARSIFEQQVLTNNLSSRNSRSILVQLPDHPLLFHPSDHMHAGLTKDIRVLWDIPLQTDADALFFLNHSRPNVWRDIELSRLTPEQHMFTSALEKSGAVGLRHYADNSPELLTLSEQLLTSHFLHIPDRNLPIFFQKYHTEHHFSFDWMRIGSPNSAPKQSLKSRLRSGLRQRIMAWSK